MGSPGETRYALLRRLAADLMTQPEAMEQEVLHQVLHLASTLVTVHASLLRAARMAESLSGEPFAGFQAAELAEALREGAEYVAVLQDEYF